MGLLLISAIFALGAAATVVSDKNINRPKMKDTSDSLAFAAVVAVIKGALGIIAYVNRYSTFYRLILHEKFLSF